MSRRCEAPSHDRLHAEAADAAFEALAELEQAAPRLAAAPPVPEPEPEPERSRRPTPS